MTAVSCIISVFILREPHHTEREAGKCYLYQGGPVSRQTLVSEEGKNQHNQSAKISIMYENQHLFSLWWGNLNFN